LLSLGVVFCFVNAVSANVVVSRIVSVVVGVYGKAAVVALFTKNVFSLVLVQVVGYLAV
jgi:hypothetical protein